MPAREAVAAPGVSPWTLAGPPVAFLLMGLVLPSRAYPVEGGIVLLCAAAVLALVAVRCGGVAVGRWGVAAAGFLGAWGLFQLAGVMRSVVPAVAREEGVSALAGVVLFALGLVSAARAGEDRPAMIRAFVLGMAVAGGLVAAHGAWQAVGPAGGWDTFATRRAEVAAVLEPGDPVREGLLHALEEGRAMGRVGAPNLFASVCVYTVLLAVGLLLGGGGRERLAGGLAGGAGLAGLLLSGSQGGILALVAGAAVLVYTVWARGAPAGRAAWVGGIVGGVAVLLVGAFLAVKLLTPVEDSRWLGVGGMEQRFLYWRAGAGMWVDAPVAGHGGAAFELLYPAYRVEGANETKYPHNWVVREAARGGLLGVVLAVGFAVAAVGAGAWRLVEDREGDVYTVEAGLLAGAVAVLLHGLVEYTMAFRETALLVFFSLGVLTGGGGAVLVPRGRVAGLGVLLVGFVAATVPLLVMGPARAERLREEVEFRLEEGEPAESLVGRATEAIEADRAHPAGWELRGHLRALAGDRLARADLEEAIRRHPVSARLRERLALLALSEGRSGEAFALMEEALARHPLDVGHRLTFAEMLLEEGEVERARELWKSARDLQAVGRLERERRAELGRRLGFPSD